PLPARTHAATCSYRWSSSPTDAASRSCRWHGTVSPGRARRRRSQSGATDESLTRMTIGKSDLGILSDLAVALGIFTPDGSPNPDWFGDPEASLTAMLSNAAQRAALIKFVDTALGGADRTTEAGVTWLPLIEIE